MKHLLNYLADFKKAGWFPELPVFETASTEPEVEIKGRKVLMFASNNYLGLASHPEVKEKAIVSIRKYGLGPGGSRFLCGNIDEVLLLEKTIAEWVGAEDAITFPTGYMANAAVFRAILDPFIGNEPHGKGNGVLISDEYNHATIIDGGRLTSAKKIVYKHLDFNSLQSALIQNIEKHPVMVVGESVYSMDGNLMDVSKFFEICKKYNSLVMIDEAHGLGVLGNTGGGGVEQFGVQKDVDIIMGTMDKALGSMGGFLAGKKDVVEYLRLSSRPYLFSSSVPTVLASATIKAIELCKDGQHLREQLRRNISFVRNNLQELGYNIIGNSELLPAIPVFLGGEKIAMQFAIDIFNEGIFAPAIRWPAVPNNSARIRLAIMAHHQQKHLDKLVEIFRKVGKKLKLI